MGVLVSLRPEEKEGKLAFRAADYGLTEQDKELRKQIYEQNKARWTSPVIEQQHKGET